MTEACYYCGEPLRGSPAKCPYCKESLEPPEREAVFDGQVEVEKTFKGQVDDFTIAYLRGAELRGAFLGDVDLFGADLASADLRGADLARTNLCYSDLRAADLRGANLRGADLSDAKLDGADLSGADLTGANLDGAHYNRSTVWPEGFDPAAAGAVYARRS